MIYKIVSFYNLFNDVSLKRIKFNDETCLEDIMNSNIDFLKYIIT